MVDLKKLFVYVPAGTIAEGKKSVADFKTLSANGKIYFLADTNEIVAKGASFGASASDLARIAALEATVNGKAAVGTEGEAGYEPAVVGLVSKVAALQTLLGESELGADEDTVIDRIEALETLVNIGEDDPDNSVVDRLSEVLDWFKGVLESEEITVTIDGEEVTVGSGAQLVADVAANKSAIGKESTKYTADDELPEGKEVGDSKEDGTGIYKRIEDLEAKNAAEDFTVEDEAVADQYVTAVAQGQNGKVAVSRTDLPIKGIHADSADYVEIDATETEGVKANTLKVKTTALGDAVGMTKVTGEDGAVSWTYADGTLATNPGLATAADVAAEIAADEEIIADALNDHEERLVAIEGSDAVVTGTRYAVDGETVTAPALTVTTEGKLTSDVVADFANYADDAAAKAINDWDAWEDYSEPAVEP